MKNSSLTVSGLLLLLSTGLSAQSPVHRWVNGAGTYNIVYAPRVGTDTTGNIYDCGTFNATMDFDPGPGGFNLSPAGGEDVFVQKIDPNGNFVWAISFGGVPTEGIGDFRVDNTGNCYITGLFRGTVDFDPGASVHNLTSNGLDDYYVMKLNSSGVFQWVQTGGSSSSNDLGVGLAFDISGNVYATGNIFGVVDLDGGSGTSNAGAANTISQFLMKIDVNGNFLWGKAISVNGTGGLDTRFATSVLTEGSKIYVLGHFNGTVDFDPTNGTNNITSQGSYDIFLQKYDASGSLLWTNTEGGSGNDRASAIMQDAAGAIYLTGFFSQTVDFDFSPSTYPLTTATNSTSFLQKIDNNSNLIWAKAMDANVYISAATLDATGNICLTGFFMNTADFDPGNGTVNMTSGGYSDYFVDVLDSSGNNIWVRTTGSSANDGAFYITADTQDNLIVSGFFLGTVDFDFGAGIDSITSATPLVTNCFIHKIGQEANSVAEQDAGLISLHSFPNPSDGTVSVQSSEEVNCRIVSETGAIVREFSLNSSNSYSHHEILPASGMYLIYAITEDGRAAVQKIMVVNR